MQELERITARRSELDTLTEGLAKQLHEVQAEREEPIVAERVLSRLAEQDRPRPLHRFPPGWRAGQYF